MAQEIEDRIRELERERACELESRRWMSSRPDRTNSFGQFAFFENKTNEKFDGMIAPLRKEAAALKCGKVSPEGNSDGHKKRKTRECVHVKKKGPKHEHCGGGKSEKSKFSDVSSSDDNADDSELHRQQGHDRSDDSDENRDRNGDSAAKRKKRYPVGDVIEIDDDSTSNYSESSLDATSNNSGNGGESLRGEDGGSSIASDRQYVRNEGSNSSVASDEGRHETKSTKSKGGTVTVDAQNNEDASFTAENNTTDHVSDGHGSFDFERDRNGSDDEDRDEDDASGEIARYHISKISASKLTMVAQGFRTEATGRAATAGRAKAAAAGHEARARSAAPFDPHSVAYGGRTFLKNHCYVLKSQDVTVGIRHFTSMDTAQCILIEKFENTIIGTEDEGVDFTANFGMGTHVQVHKCTEHMSLSKLGAAAENVREIPELIYEPQTDGAWHTFGYFYERKKMKPKGRRKGMRSLELFAGAGGSLLGYEIAGFDTVMAVETDKDAVRTLQENNKGLKVYHGCIKKFTEQFGVLKCALGKTDHLNFGSPCQDFSSANRSQLGRTDRADLSLFFVDLICMTSCSTAVFENVVGIWQRKWVHYLKNITKELLRLGYQVRCTVMYACDYGDPQKRPRFFMFVSKNTVPIPSFPSATHGSDPKLWPYVTVKDAFSRLENEDTLPNMHGKTCGSRPGQHGIARLMPHDVALTLRASAVTPFHYSEDRCINVREAACLQSFPLRYTFHGNLISQYKQIGNAVPVELSTAVAHSIRQVLFYEYEEEEVNGVHFPQI